MTIPHIQSIYTDGACSGNPGPGGWGVVICFADGEFHELGGRDRQTTNNRMEIQAAIAALEWLTKSGQTQPVTLYTDSEYLKNGITKWIQGWKNKGWKTSTGSAVINQDLWELLDKLNSKQIQWHHVRAHSGDPHNERCDAIARAFSVGKPPSLQQFNPQTPRESTNPKPSFPSPSLNTNVSQVTDTFANKTIESKLIASNLLISDSAMIDSNADSLDNLPREVRVEQLHNLIETLHIADEVATKGYLITSSELADLMDVNASAVTSRGDKWVWRNWVVSRARREGNQILWLLERIDQVTSTN
ncbi:ribonuclease HI [Oscillatoriales cyanobacterium USR001]|nr:ribonuclease HI [Oscillatoriales cyanobacterium USR001]